jgi:hypothetical protein
MILIRYLSKYQRVDDENEINVPVNYGGNKGSNPKPKKIKIFKSGSFASYAVVGEYEQKTHGGKFRVLNDSIYTENVQTARNKPMIGKTYSINYKIEDGVLKISGTYDTPDGKVRYTETWVKIQSGLIVSNKTRDPEPAK